MWMFRPFGAIRFAIAPYELRADWQRLRGMSDAAIHAAIESDPEVMPTDEGFWKNAAVVCHAARKLPPCGLTLIFWNGFGRSAVIRRASMLFCKPK